MTAQDTKKQAKKKQAKRKTPVATTTTGKKAAANTPLAKKDGPDQRVSTAKSKGAATITYKTQTPKAQGVETIRKTTSKSTQTPLVTNPTGAGAARTSAAPLSPPLVKKGSAKLSVAELDSFRKELLALHERLTTKIDKMRESALKRDDEVNPEEDGTDAFDRLFTLERAGTDQITINQINNALRAIKDGTYGVCDLCDGLIENARLHALPFVKNCIACQSEQERKRNGRPAAPRRVVP